MKMSLCNTFRFFAVSTTIVLSIVGSPVPVPVGRQESIPTKGINQDLEHQGSLTVELKSDDKGANYINSLKLNNVKDNTNSFSLDSEVIKKNGSKNSDQATFITEETTQNISTKDIEDTTSVPLELDKEAVVSTTTLNMTTSQRNEATTNKISRDEIISPVNIQETIEKETSIQKKTASESHDATIENDTKITSNTTTTIKLEHSTPATTMDTVSTGNVKISDETSSPEPHIEPRLVKSMKLSSSSSETSSPKWKKYTTIDRKRLSTSSDEVTTLTDTSSDNTENLASTMSEELTTVTEKSEVMLKLESAQGRISLQDAITSDIPSLEKLKSDLLSFPKFTTKSEMKLDVTSTEESITKTDMTTYITTTSPSTYSSETPNTVSSKRAGYLDLSSKNLTEDDINLKPNYTESLQGPFDAETPDTQDESLDDKTDRRAGSQSQLAEDAIKEELLKEEMLNDNEEISKRNRDEEKQIDTDIAALQYTEQDNVTKLDDKLVQPPRSVPDENLSVRPINLDKVKNTVLYPVNPNYKPLKKIEVQPAKPFVRDPDDNSWRNESLSSLGIVFKPKNSSKPFTQVLKNKTETEWNNLPEKDIKSEVPDLRVRLEQIAQKRKSKKKKIDSFGNVFYTDYEENSSSEEKTSTPHVEDTTFVTVSTTDVSTPDITIVTPVQTTSPTTSAAPSSGADVPAFTTTVTPNEKTQTTPKQELTKVTTLKRPKMFNFFDYYETNDDEDIQDYLNMAKIDLKKYTVPLHTTFTPYTSPPLPILYTNPMTQYTPERKGTIQYFPPRTTKRPKKNKHKNIRDEINPLTLTDSPKHVLPISYNKLTTPYSSEVYYNNGPDARFKEELVPKTYDHTSYLSTPPLTTMPDEDFGVIGNDGRYNRPNYVIKHYNEVGAERGRPAHDDSVPDFVRTTTTRGKTTIPEDYDYGTDFRKDLLDRFVADLSDKSGRFGSGFPVVYNNSIVHGSYDDKEAAMSRAYFRRPYGDRDYKPLVRDPYDPNCENVTVELSPAYELHYYVPEQEEKQEVDPKPLNLPVRYSL